MFHHIENLTDGAGNTQKGWSVDCYADGGDPLTAPAVAIYADRAGLVPVPSGRAQAGEFGFVSFFIPSGLYGRRYYDPSGVVRQVVEGMDMYGASAAAEVAQTVANAAISTTQAGIATTQAGIATTQAGIATTSATSAAVSASIAAAVNGADKPYANAYASTLPKGVRSGTIGGTAITGATVGTYALTPVGGSITGVVANLVVTSATAATIQIVNPGLGSGTTPPTWANPAGATIPAGTTLTAVVSTLIDDQKTYWAASSDSSQILLYGNNGGSLATAPFGGAQVAFYTKAGVDAIVASLSASTTTIAQIKPMLRYIPGNVIRFGDAAGNFIFELNIDGPNISITDALLSSTMLSDILALRGMRQVLKLIPGSTIRSGDRAGNYLESLDAAGETALTATATYASASVGGKMQVQATSGGVISTISDGTANDTYPALINGSLRFTSDRDGAVPKPYRMTAAGANIMQAGRPKAIMFIGYGQSFSVGTGDGTGANAQTAITTASHPGGVLMFNGGVRPLGAGPNAPYNLAISPSVITSLAPAAAAVLGLGGTEAWGETFMETLGYKVFGAGGGPIIIETVGISGATYEQLNKGNTNYANILASVSQARAITGSLGWDLEVYVCWEHGHANSGDTRAAYAGKVQQLYTDLSADIGGITGQTTLHMFVGQASNIPSGVITPAIWDAARANANIHLVGTWYDVPYQTNNGAVHPNSLGYTYIGDAYGRAANVVLAGSTWTPLQPVYGSVTRSGAVVTMPLEGMTGSVVIDTTNVTAQTNYGLTAISDSGAVTINSVTLSGGTLTIMLATSSPGTNLRIKSGSKTNIADSDPMLSTQGAVARPKRLVIFDCPVS